MRNRRWMSDLVRTQRWKWLASGPEGRHFPCRWRQPPVSNSPETPFLRPLSPVAQRSGTGRARGLCCLFERLVLVCSPSRRWSHLDDSRPDPRVNSPRPTSHAIGSHTLLDSSSLDRWANTPVPMATATGPAVPSVCSPQEIAIPAQLNCMAPSSQF